MGGRSLSIRAVACVDDRGQVCYKQVFGWFCGAATGGFAGEIPDFRINPVSLRSPNVPSSERRKEIKRRRHRRKKVSRFAKKLEKATVSERVTFAGKLRAMTPGSEVIISNWELEKR
jgi:hypothetical protein